MTTKARELHKLKIDELKARERTLVDDLSMARFKHHTNQLDKSSELKRLRRDIARLKTVINEKVQSEQGIDKIKGKAS